jgi:hypothetical protein
MWLQGFDEAPALVKKCYLSWRRYNSEWKVVFLNEGNIGEYLDLQKLEIKNENVTKQAFSDLVRINLLAQYGGVWVDATCLCCAPLNTWLGEYTKSGFFAFYKPGRDRLVSSWFLASTQDCYLVSKWRDESNQYWRNSSFSGGGNRLLIEILSMLFNHNTYMTKFWFSFFVRRIIRIYPYYWFHYLFGRVIQKDAQCMRVWTKTKKYSADIPHKVLFSGLLRPLPQEIKHYIDSKQSPLYKLAWRYDLSEYKEGCILHYLLESTLGKRL